MWWSFVRKIRCRLTIHFLCHDSSVVWNSSQDTCSSFFSKYNSCEQFCTVIGPGALYEKMVHVGYAQKAFAQTFGQIYGWLSSRPYSLQFILYIFLQDSVQAREHWIRYRSIGFIVNGATPMACSFQNPVLVEWAITDDALELTLKEDDHMILLGSASL